MFSLIRSCKVEELSRNWQDIHHEQGGKLFRLLRKENCDTLRFDWTEN